MWRAHAYRSRGGHHAGAVFAAAPPAGGILLAGTLALGRFALATAALDTGSPFGGMGASRDMTIAALAEPALMLGLFASALAAGSMNLGVLVRTLVQEGVTRHPADILAFAGLFMIVIAETGRIPVDNPATHLELTMIHEAMVLEYAGPTCPGRMGFRRQRALVSHPTGGSLHAGRNRDQRRASGRAGSHRRVGRQSVRAGNRRHSRGEHECEAALFRVPELVSISLGLGFLALAIRFL